MTLDKQSNARRTAVESKSNRCCIRCVCEDYIVRTFCWLSVRPFVNCILDLWPRDLKMALPVLLVWSKNLYLNSLWHILRLYITVDDQQYVDLVNLTFDLSILKRQSHLSWENRSEVWTVNVWAYPFLSYQLSWDRQTDKPTEYKAWSGLLFGGSHHSKLTITMTIITSGNDVMH